MECVIPNRYIKLFAKSIQCMATVGDDMFLEAGERKLTLRTLNISRSAFLAFSLDERFFDSYNLVDNIEKKYSVKLKPCQAVFRQFTNMEKCTIRLNEEEQRLTFEILCKHGIQKVYKLTFEECDSIQAIYSKEDSLNKIVSAPKKFIDSINNFHTSLDEISIVVSKESVKIKSYVDDVKAASKVLHTELSMDPFDFEEFDVRNETQVTFCLKEFKAILNFCEASGQPVTMYFERGGRPICLSVKYFGVFESDFVLATLLEPTSQSGNTSSSTSASSSSQASNPSGSTPQNGLKKRKADNVSPGSIQSWSQSNKQPNDKVQSPRSPLSPNITPQSSSSAIITSGSSPIKSPAQSLPNVDNAYDETFVDGDYEDEVDGSPQPPAKKMKSLSAEAARNEIALSSNKEQDENKDESETMQEEEILDDEEIPCSVEE